MIAVESGVDVLRNALEEYVDKNGKINGKEVALSKFEKSFESIDGAKAFIALEEAGYDPMVYVEYSLTERSLISRFGAKEARAIMKILTEKGCMKVFRKKIFRTTVKR